MTQTQLIDSMAVAIARMEGYMDAAYNPRPGTIAYRNNNPGNLRVWGSLPQQSGYAVFPTAAEGWGALKIQIRLNLDRGLTLYEFFGGKPGVYPGYAPAADANHPKQYAEFVAAQVGIPPDAVIRDAVAAAAPGASSQTPTTAPAGPYTIPGAYSTPGNVDQEAWAAYLESITGATSPAYARWQRLEEALPWVVAALGAAGLWVAWR